MPASSVLAESKVKDLGTYTISGANTIAFAPGKKAFLKRLILVVTTAEASAKAVLSLQRRPVAGAASSQVALGTIETPAAYAAGAVYYYDFGNAFGQPVSGVYAAGEMPAILAGQDFAIVSDGGGSAGVVNVYVEYIEEPINPSTAIALTRTA